MSSDSEEETSNIKLLPERSKKRYDVVYNNFMNWRNEKNINSFSEEDLLTYFAEITDSYKSSTLWSQYSILRRTLNIRHNVNIEKYTKLRDFLNLKSKGYEPKKTKTFTPEEICRFINEAPDDKYLAIKVYIKNNNRNSKAFLKPLKNFIEVL